MDSRYLSNSTIVDWDDPTVSNKAMLLSHGLTDDVEISRRCFLFVRDEILHSVDYRRNPVTLRASEVLEHGTGFCFAKSHLLAALLRANGIPAGLCYQRLAFGRARSGFCLHGLNAVYLKEHGWYRVDARGDSGAIRTSFSPPKETLAFVRVHEGEADLPGIWPDPIPCVVKALSGRSNYMEVLSNLPDLEPADIGLLEPPLVSWR